MQKPFVVRGKLHLFPMEAAWIYLPIPLHKVPKVPRGGWGSVPVMATIGKTTWRTSLFPMRKDDYFIPIKRAVCKAEGLAVGDTTTVRFTVTSRKARYTQ